MNRSPLRLGFLLNALALAVAWLAPSQLVYAQCPQICDGSSFNTAFGVNALPSDGGFNNTAIGFDALFSNTGGSGNTATGSQALEVNTVGGQNTATGQLALNANTTGGSNTATGFGALLNNTSGGVNTATGAFALQASTTGSGNTATGYGALGLNSTGFNNTATGNGALGFNTTGTSNTATGASALFRNTIGVNNTATGDLALSNNTSGSGNIALGEGAGRNLTIGDRNIDIGNPGVVAEANTIRIGRVGAQTTTFIAGISGATVPTGVAVVVDSDGHLGTTTSSARFKDAIKPMDKASEAILALKPVTFRYKHELDPEGIPQFGLVAEDVEKVNPDLVARDEQGKPYTVRYEAVNAMLLNEFLKEHKAFVTEQRKVEELEAKLAKQEKDFSARLREQDAKIQQVSAHLEESKPLLQTIANNQ